MRCRSLLLSAALLPLVACFEVVIPEEPEPEPEPAELQEGEWIFDMEIVSVDGDCWAMGLDAEDVDAYEYAAWAWIETDGRDGVSIDLDGFLLEGTIHGDELWADGSLSYEYSYSTDDEPMPADEDDGGVEDGGDADPSSGETGDAPVDCFEGDGDAEILPICEEVEPYPGEESIHASLDADILRPDRMRGMIFVDYVDFDTYCSVGFAFEAEALDEDPCDCDCCCDDGDPEPYVAETGEVSEGSSGGAPD